jgi:hypothetical protein
VSYVKPKICVLDLNHISIRIFHQSRPSSATQPYCGAQRLWGVPHTNRLLKAIAGSGFDAKLCADVYNLYVKRNISRGGCIFTWQSFQHRLVDSGNLNTLYWKHAQCTDLYPKNMNDKSPEFLFCMRVNLVK